MKRAVFAILLVLCLPSIFAEIMISEIMYNPYGTETKKEWIEIYNSGDTSVDITDWKIQDGSTKRVLLLYQGGWLIAPDDFAIISRNSENFSAEYDFKNNIYSSSFSLTNTGKDLFLLDSSDNIIDHVRYEDDAEEGYSLELKDLTKDNNNMDNWIQGIFGGSPGEIIRQENDVPEFNLVGAASLIVLFFIFRKISL